MSTTMVTGPDESEDGFSPLMNRLDSVIHRLKLAAEHFGEVAITPAEEHYSAAFVVVDIESWTIRDCPPIGQGSETIAG